MSNVLFCMTCITGNNRICLSSDKGCNGEMKEILENKSINSKAIFNEIDENGKQNLPPSVTDTSYKLLGGST